MHASRLHQARIDILFDSLLIILGITYLIHVHEFFALLLRQISSTLVLISKDLFLDSRLDHFDAVLLQVDLRQVVLSRLHLLHPGRQSVLAAIVADDGLVEPLAHSLLVHPVVPHARLDVLQIRLLAECLHLLELVLAENAQKCRLGHV